jgi:hypothetical protein
MEKEIARELVTACESASAALTAAEAVICRMPPGEERSQHMQVLAGLFADLLGQLRAPAVRQYPDLASVESPGEPDTILDSDEEAEVSRLSPRELELIDEALLAGCAACWRKVARVVATTMTSIDRQFQDIPDGFYARRVIELVERGKLQSQGNLRYMRFSEVRLPDAKPRAV